MQIKTTMRYYLTPIRIATIFKKQNKTTKKEVTSVGKDVEKNGTLAHCWWDCKIIWLLSKTVWKFLKKI